MRAGPTLEGALGNDDGPVAEQKHPFLNMGANACDICNERTRRFGHEPVVDGSMGEAGGSTMNRTCNLVLDITWIMGVPCDTTPS